MNNDPRGLGRKALDYINSNGTEIAAGVVTCAVGAGIAIAGPKAVAATAVVGGCLFAGLAVNIAAKALISIGSSAIADATEKVKHSFEKPSLQGGRTAAAG